MLNPTVTCYVLHGRPHYCSVKTQHTCMMPVTSAPLSPISLCCGLLSPDVTVSHLRTSRSPISGSHHLPSPSRSSLVLSAVDVYINWTSLSCNYNLMDKPASCVTTTSFCGDPRVLIVVMTHYGTRNGLVVYSAASSCQV